MSKEHFQIVVVGSGFAGSLMAMMAHRLGFSTALVERGQHPRFAIGESSTPLANLLLEEIAADYDLPAVRPLCKWGTWQKSLPHLACGLKRGFTFYKHELGKPFGPDPKRQKQLMVAASPNDEIADTHWYRQDFDHYLVQQAQTLGVTYFDGVELTGANEETSGMRLTGKHRGRPLNLTAEFVIDASGPRGFLHRALHLPEKAFATLPPTQSLFSHFTGVGPLPDGFCPGDGILPPYEAEQAAVHHIFPGGWIWVLKFNNGITSAGVAATDSIANALDFQSGELAWRRLLKRLPSLDKIFRGARAVVPFIHQSRVAFQSEVITGGRWALLPSAAGVVDPLLSTGFPLTLLGVLRLARLLQSHWDLPALQPGLQEYAQLTRLELEATAGLVGALYATMDNFELFQELSLLYFVCASFSETARRLGKSHLADGFLLCRHPEFSAQFNRICSAARKPLATGETRNLARCIREAIAPFDVAGLTDRLRHPWYPALSADLLRNASKLESNGIEISAMLQKCGFAVSHDKTDRGLDAACGVRTRKPDAKHEL